MSYSASNPIYQEEIYSVDPKPVVVLGKPWNTISDPEKTVLEKILGLASISLNNIKIVTSEKLDILRWPDHPQIVLAFGVEAPGLSKNEILEVQGVKLMVTSDLASLESADKETKQKLALAVKSLFG